MESVNHLREAVIRDITAAFCDVRLGDGITLDEAALIEGGTDIEDILRNPRNGDLHGWQDVPEIDIEKHYDLLSCLDAAGYRFYLPAYMIWVLQHFDTSESQTIDWTVYSLTLHEKHDLRAWQMRRFEQFTLAQAQAIHRFLSYMAKQDDNHIDARAASEAIATYWGRYAAV